MCVVVWFLFVLAFVASGCSFSASVGGTPQSAAEEATIVDEDTVNVQSLNVLVDSDVEAFELAAVGELERAVGTAMGTETSIAAMHPWC